MNTDLETAHQMLITVRGKPHCFRDSEDDAREALEWFDKPRHYLEGARVWSQDDDGQAIDITEDFCARWLTDLGHAITEDFDDWFAQHPAFIRAHYEDQARDIWQGGMDYREGQRDLAADYRSRAR